MAKDKKQTEKKFPNFLGDDFLLITANLFLEEAGLANADNNTKGEFINKIMTDFLDKATAMILNRTDEDKMEELIKVAGSNMTYLEREAVLEEIIPGFKEDMATLMELFKRKIRLEVYTK